MLIFAAALVAASDPPLSVQDLVAAVARYEKPRADKFSPRTTDRDIIGKPFRAVVTFAELTDEGGPRIGRDGGWLYNPDTATLTLKPWVDMIVGGDLDSDPSLHGVEKMFRGFVVAARGRYLGKAVEGNAFGATINVDQYLGTALTVGKYEEGFSANLFPDGLQDKDLVKTLPMEPAVARAVTPNLKLVVEGTIEAYSPGHAIACGEALAPATFERHSEQLMHQCVVSGDIRRFAVEDGRDGHVYAEWMRSVGVLGTSPNSETTLAVPSADPKVLQAFGQQALSSIDQKTLQSLQAKLAAEYKVGDIGILAPVSPAGLFIVAVATSSPASVAGLKPGEFIEGVNGISLMGLTQNAAMAILKGLPKTFSFKVTGVGEVWVRR